MKIAIIGSGISGLTAAYYLKDRFDITLFEKNAYLGGHTNTIECSWRNHQYAIDTGFIVFNKKTYPNFLKMLDGLYVEYLPTTMSFSVRDDDLNFEYAGSSLKTLFCQKRNFLNIHFYQMIIEILKFNKYCKDNRAIGALTVDEFLTRYNFHRYFKEYYLLPMCASIWSTDINKVKSTPLKFLVNFFNNHGLAQIKDRPQWYVIKGGSHEYIKKLSQNLHTKLLTDTPIWKVSRNNHGVTVYGQSGIQEDFDRVILACHSDEALNLIDRPSTEEQRTLGAIDYQTNRAILHLDTRLLPKNKSAWSAWNFSSSTQLSQSPIVTYHMKTLQNLKDDDPDFCVTLNGKELIDEKLILKEIEYAHPVIDQKAVDAQSRIDTINGENHTYFCGAYWGNGFHEDGVASGMNAAQKLIEEIDGKQLSL